MEHRRRDSKRAPNLDTARTNNTIRAGQKTWTQTPQSDSGLIPRHKVKQKNGIKQPQIISAVSPKTIAELPSNRLELPPHQLKFGGRRANASTFATPPVRRLIWQSDTLASPHLPTSPPHPHPSNKFLGKATKKKCAKKTGAVCRNPPTPAPPSETGGVFAWGKELRKRTGGLFGARGRVCVYG